MVGPTSLVWEKYPSKKSAEMWFHRLRRKTTRLAGYTVVAFLTLKFLVRIFMTRTMLDSVTEKLEQMIFGALQKDFCPAPITTEQEVESIIYKSRMPQIRLDPNKFLLPILAQGAQGQLRGLRESIILSVKLNRTLVVPPFFVDNWMDVETFEVTEGEGDEDDGSLSILTAGFFDIAKLADFIHITSVQEFKTQCDSMVESIFQSRQKYCKGMKIERMRTFTEDMEIFLARNQSDCEETKIIKYPEESVMARGKRLQIPFAETEVAKLFSGNEKCATWLFPLFNFDFSIIFPSDDILSNYFEPSAKVKFSQEDIDLLSNTIIATPRPAYIRGIVDSFVEEVMKSTRYVAIHWTFNDNDWNIKCKSPHEADQQLLDWCKKARIFRKTGDMAPLADGFIEIIKDLYEQQVISPIVVYLATPEMRNFAQTEIIKKYFKSRQIHAFDAADLTSYIEFHFGGCQFIQDHFQLVLQQLELDIGIKAVSFFNAADSEWSYTVHMERFVRNQVKWDHSNYEIISRLKME